MKKKPKVKKPWDILNLDTVEFVVKFAAEVFKGRRVNPLRGGYFYLQDKNIAQTILKVCIKTQKRFPDPSGAMDEYFGQRLLWRNSPVFSSCELKLPMVENSKHEPAVAILGNNHILIFVGFPKMQQNEAVVLIIALLAGEVDSSHVLEYIEAHPNPQFDELWKKFK